MFDCESKSELRCHLKRDERMFFFCSCIRVLSNCGLGLRQGHDETSSRSHFFLMNLLYNCSPIITTSIKIMLHNNNLFVTIRKWMNLRFLFVESRVAFASWIRSRVLPSASRWWPNSLSVSVAITSDSRHTTSTRLTLSLTPLSMALLVLSLEDGPASRLSLFGLVVADIV